MTAAGFNWCHATTCRDIPVAENWSATMRAYTQVGSGVDHLRLGAIFSLPATWFKRACFRAELRADLRDKPDFLRDIGIGLHEAQAEAPRFFWEPLLLKHR
jgi:uncharacterized protein YjiS (DUF1127 family)